VRYNQRQEKSVSLSQGRKREEFLLAVVSGERRSLGAAVLRGLLRGASYLYALGLGLNRWAYRLRLVRTTRLPAHVISVGNLTLGGTGKTSCVLWLADRFRAAGRKVAILSRGHGRESRGRVGVVADGERLRMTAAEAGDEPFLLARTLGDVPVLVGKSRIRTGRYAVEQFGAEVLILDDGFQYWRLIKDWDIALVDATSPFGVGSLFPAGTRREPLSHLARADLLWITRSECVTEEELKALRARLQTLCPTTPIVVTEQRPAYVRSLPETARRPPEELCGRRVCALSSIGNPAAFELTLERLGVAALIPARFPDHHRYRPEEVAAVATAAQGEADLIVTTEKDATRLPPDLSVALPIEVLGIEIVFRDAAQEIEPALSGPRWACGLPLEGGPADPGGPCRPVSSLTAAGCGLKADR